MFAHAPTQVKPVPSIGVPFVPIPHEIAQRRDISSLAKLVFSVVANHARMRRGDSSPMTNAQIADAVGASVSAVRRALDELESVGLIERRFGASERVRESVAITFRPGQVARPCATPAAPAEQPGCAPADHEVARPCATPLNTKNEERKNGGTSLDSRGTAEEKPSPAEVAAAIRGMFGRVGMAAKAGAGFVRRDRRPPCPVPRDAADLARMRAARAESLRIPHTFGELVKPGNL
jgi:DNA-binding transcriptional ArsR family regulator